MPSLPSQPALAPPDGVPGSESQLPSESSHEYSNEGMILLSTRHGNGSRLTKPRPAIEILHDVVANAQQSLNQLPERDRLPTNALFQAYDTVLPLYGLDPESDQHISRLVFRIGGERGDGSLIDKFRAVMSRMGIDVQFDTAAVSAGTNTDEIRGGPAAGLTTHEQHAADPDVELLPQNPPRISSDTTAHSDSSGRHFEKDTELRYEEAYDLACHALRNRLFLEWHRIAPTLSKERRTLDVLAGSRRRDVTIRTVGQYWLATVRKTQSDRFERIASRAREIYLVTKIFAQWQDYASDKAERAAVARRHILRLRHFDSWKEAALDEERTVCTFVRGVHLPRWIAHSTALGADESRASLTYHENLVAKCFCDWRFLTLDAKAAEWRIKLVKQIRMEHWLRESKEKASMDRLASAQHEHNQLAKTASLWRDAAGRGQALNLQSEDQQRCIELSRCHELWRSSAPRLDGLERRSRSNHHGNVFSAWLLEARVRSFQQKCNNRFLQETFRDWRLNHKMQTLQRERDRALLGRTFDLAVRHCKETGLEEKYASIPPLAMWVRQQTMARHFSLWDETARLRHTRERMADDDRAKRDKIGLLNAWYDDSMRDAEMDRWARRGEFYLTMDCDFGQWKRWSKTEKERKLRDVYARAKHGANTRLVLHCWRGWHRQSLAVAAADASAAETLLTRDEGTKAVCFETWVSTSLQNQGRELTCQRELRSSLLNLWASVAANIAVAETEAWGFWAERIADSCWKRWNIVFQRVEGQAYSAAKAEERHRTTSSHEAFIMWHAMSSDSGSYGPRDSIRRAATVTIDYHSRSETSRPIGRQPFVRPLPWTRSNMSEYVPGVERQPVRGQPAYGESVAGTSPVNTPTRWTGRMRPILGLPSTTPVGALPTPYERELRARYDAETTSPQEWAAEEPEGPNEEAQGGEQANSRGGPERW
jgi:protein SFI1